MDFLSASSLLLISGSLSFLFSGIESGFLALNPVRIRSLARNQYRAAKKLKSHLEEPEPFLWTILIGNTVSNFFFVAMVVYLLRNHTTLGSFSTILVCIGALFAFYTFFDLLPKMLVRRFPNRLTVLLTYPFELFFALLAPFVGLISRIKSTSNNGNEKSIQSIAPFQNRDDLKRIMQESEANLRPDERRLITRVMELQNQTVQSVMKPFAPELWITPDQTIEQTIQLCRSHSRSRLVVRDSKDKKASSTGIFHLKQAIFTSPLENSQPIRSLITPALSIQRKTVLDEALQQMKGSGQRLAIVIDEEKNELGVISLNDILRNIFKDVNL
jgi:putative hemolysin